jgi:hypothetical protein
VDGEGALQFLMVDWPIVPGPIVLRLASRELAG